MSSTKSTYFLLILLVSGVFFNGCIAPSHRGDVDSKGNLTVGTVQKSIKHGMSSVGVAEVLGSPNIVQNDGMGEVWIYDKISSQVSTSASSGTLILISGASGASSSSQRTLTVIIKFDEESKVRKFSYHTSRF
jgi:outer membrane protein assembly factor BamE (lipoprotein component of BamABCDE complex)